MKNQPEKSEPYRWAERTLLAAFLLAALALYLYLEYRPDPLAVLAADGRVESLASAMPNQGWAPMQVYFSARGSQSLDGPLVHYEWDLDGNGVFDTDATVTGGYATYHYVKPGRYVVTLRVTDGNGRSATDQVTINVRHPGSSSVDYWTVFDDSQVRRIQISLSQKKWDNMWSDVESKVTVRADANIFGEQLNDVGFRMRGQFSLRESRDKKPWEIETDAYISGQEYHNLRQLVLINNIVDPTMLRAKVSYDAMAFAGVPTSHATFVELWIDLTDDDQPPIFWGVYTLVEEVDTKFFSNRFGQETRVGNLYKASHAQHGPMNLVYYGEQIEDYPRQGGDYAYGKVNNLKADDYSDIVELCRVVDGTNYATPEEFSQALEQVLDVDGFLRYLAVVVTTMDWDSYPNTGNNYYLFHNSLTGQFEWIPWDLSMGKDPQYPLYQWAPTDLVVRAPLTDHILGVDRYRRRYDAYLDLLNRYFFNEEQIARRVTTYHNLIAPYVRQGSGDKMYVGTDPLFSLDQFDNEWPRLIETARSRSQYIRQILDTGQ